jgi:hypothetical protein
MELFNFKLLKMKKGVSLLIVIFIMLIFSILGAGLASIFAGRAKISYGFYRSSQAFYICDIGMERGKQLLADNPTYRPPEPPGYLREYITIGEIQGYYDIYIEDTVDGVSLRVESAVESP